MRLPNPLCWLRTAYRSLIRPGTLWNRGIPAPMLGHNYAIVEEHDGCHVEVMRCMECGKVEVSWSTPGAVRVEGEAR